ncbi:MAG: hypothetical protein ACRDRG_13285 [Pseudonocardiaceae bacterium]
MHDRSVTSLGGQLIVAAVQPLQGVGGEQQPAGVRIDIQAAREAAVDPGEKTLGLCFGTEGLGFLPSRGLSPVRLVMAFRGARYE